LERMCDLLFEVSNEDRLRILRVLEAEAKNVTGLSRELGLTTQESSRHLSRLGDVGLTSKDADGNHYITPYGMLTLRLLQGLDLTTRHADYFMTHSLSGLPPEFVGRIGELGGSTRVDDVMVAVHRIEETIQGAEEYLLNINLPYIASTFPMIRGAFERGIKARFLHTRDLVVPQIMMEERRREFDKMTIDQFIRAGLYDEKLIEKVDLVLYISEKEVGLVAFPLQDGGYDYLGFTSGDERTHKWCVDLFEHYWERASPAH